MSFIPDLWMISVWAQNSINIGQTSICIIYEYSVGNFQRLDLCGLLTEGLMLQRLNFLPPGIIPVSYTISFKI